MIELFNEPARAALGKAATRRVIQLGVGAAVTLAAALALFVLRQQLATMAATILGGGAVIFWWDARARADVTRARRVNAHAVGLRREEEGVFLRADASPVVRDGLSFIRWTLERDGEERYLYWDESCPMPKLARGARLRVVHSGNDILAYEVLA